jgi:hypothetical protein
VCLGISLGGKSSTRLIARLFLVDVSEFLKSFFSLNDYGIFTLHLFQDYEISSLKPYENNHMLLTLS